jgi:hypothetical protein
MTQKPHDALFRATFEQPEHASAALRGLLPPDLVSRLEWSSLALEASGLISDDLGELVVDLLYSVQLVSKNPAFVYVLYEHQSSVDPRMALRVLEYMCAIWKRFSREHPPSTPLPPIVPVVLYHGGTAWTAATSLGELFQLDGDDAIALHAFVPGFRFVLDDLSRESGATLEQRVWLTAAGRLTLFVLARARGASFLDEIRLHASVFRAVLAADDGKRALELVMSYIQLVADADRPQVEAVLIESVGPEAREVFMTIAERLIQEGIEQGIEQGIERERRAVLVKLLTLKFGDPPADVQRRLDAASPEDLDRWIARVLGAETLGAVFASAR